MMRVKYICSLVLASLENLFYSGLMYGWPFLEDILKSQGYFSDLCESAKNDTLTTWLNHTADMSMTATASAAQTYRAKATSTSVVCDAQTEHFNLIFTISAMTNILLCFVSGFLFDKMGTWFCKAISTPLFFSAFALLAQASSSSAYLIYPAMLCLSAGSALVYMVNYQFANLFSSARTTIISLTNGLFVSSGFVLWLIKLAYEQSISTSAIFYVLGAVLVVFFFAFLLLSPRGQIPYPLPQGFDYGMEACQSKAQSVDINLNPTDKKPQVKTNKTPRLSVFSPLGAMLYASNFVLFFIMNLHNLFYLGTFDTWLAVTAGHQAEQMSFVFGVISSLGGLAAPFVGLVDDLLVKHYRRGCNDCMETARIRSSKTFALLASLVAILFSVCVAIPYAPLQYLSFLMLPVSRIGCYSYSYVTISTTYSSRHVGKLTGMIWAIGGVFSLLQYPLLRYVLHYCGGDFTNVNIIFVALSFVTLICPLSLHLARHRIKRIISMRKVSDASVSAHFLRTETAANLIENAEGLA